MYAARNRAPSIAAGLRFCAGGHGRDDGLWLYCCGGPEMFGRQWRWNTRHITPLLITPVLTAALWPAGAAKATPPPERPAHPGSPDWFRDGPARAPTTPQFAPGQSGPIDLSAGSTAAP